MRELVCYMFLCVGLAKHFTRQDRINIVLYFSQMPVEGRSQSGVGNDR
jgi:hypothetical protein